MSNSANIFQIAKEYLKNLLQASDLNTPSQVHPNNTMRAKQPFNLGSLLESATSNSTNGTALGLGDFSITTILENFVPGYGPIHNFVLLSFGFDVTILVSFGVALYVANRLVTSLISISSGLVAQYYTSEITISSTDEIHAHLIGFLAHKYETYSSRRLMAETPSKTSWELDAEDASEPDVVTDAGGNIKWLNFSNQEAKTMPRFTPALGSHNFWHGGTYFMLKRKQQVMFDEIGSGGALKDEEVLTLSCFGRSTTPIKGLIEHAKARYYFGLNKKTVIKRPSGSERRRYGGKGSWAKISERPCRPLNTVVLDEKKKMEVLADINEYLSPATARWYANRGIPYRRGYLLYGPPGTGKTSLTFALAGVFGLDIHVISLLDPTLTEEELGTLFTSLPGRCIVLLEDIDTAGLVRREAETSATDSKETGEGSGELNVLNLAKALKKANQQSDEEKKKGITLSGLLNIIDGVASHEGRVLVMTTNHPEKLDEALIRPGRVDHQVAFTNATRSQIAQLFERMYTNDLPARTLPLSALAQNQSHSSSFKSTNAKNTNLNTKSKSSIEKLAQDGKGEAKEASSDAKGNVKAVGAVGEEEELTDEELKIVAKNFADEIPENVFSPAEIQGFLLKRKKEPRKAVLEVGEWVGGMLERKMGGGGGF